MTILSQNLWFRKRFLGTMHWIVKETFSLSFFMINSNEVKWDNWYFNFISIEKKFQYFNLSFTSNVEFYLQQEHITIPFETWPFYGKLNIYFFLFFFNTCIHFGGKMTIIFESPLNKKHLINTRLFILIWLLFSFRIQILEFELKKKKKKKVCQN